MPIVGSHTLFNTLEICPHQCYRRYVLKDIKFQPNKKADWGNNVHTAMEYRIRGGKPLPPNMQVAESFAAPFDGHHPLVEIKLGVTREGQTCDFFAQNVYIRGKLDAVIIKGAAAYMGDHKSGSKWEDPAELEIGAMLLHAWHPTLQTIKGQYYWLETIETPDGFWLRSGKAGQLYDLSHTPKIWARSQATMEELAERERTGRWEKRKNKLCEWCSVKDCEHNPGVR